MFPCALARQKPQAHPTKPKSKLDCLLAALRNAKELAIEMEGSASIGWPVWWLQNVVLVYSARPDKESICDALSEPALPAFRYLQLTRTQCLDLLRAMPSDFSHFGSHLPSAAECAAHNLPTLSEFVWPTAVKCTIKYQGRVLAVCSATGILWIADTGCGYHLVPECDVKRGRAVVVPNPGAQRLSTANGEIEANECVKFSLTEVGLNKQLATILPETPRVLSVGALCCDELATFVWPAGGTPYFTLSDGRVIYCEVHGRVPYLRTGSFSSQVGPRSSAALPLVAATLNNVPPNARQPSSLTAPPPTVSNIVAPSATHPQQAQFQHSATHPSQDCSQGSRPALAPSSGYAAAPNHALPAGDSDIEFDLDDDYSSLPEPPPAEGDEEAQPAAPPAERFEDGFAAPLSPLPRLSAAQRADYAEAEDGRNYETHPLVGAEVPPAGPPAELDAEIVVPPVPPEDEHNVRARKAEATSLRHLLTHHPKNVYCTTSCRAKCQRAPHRRKHHRYWKGKPEPTQFGDQVTADHIVAYSDNSMGVTGHQAAVVFGDRATGYFDGFPLKGKTTPDTSHALRCFAGSERIVRAWTDNSPELIATMIAEKVVHDLATQGQPQSNGRAERLVRRTMEGTKTLLLQAGLRPSLLHI